MFMFWNKQYILVASLNFVDRKISELVNKIMKNKLWFHAVYFLNEFFIFIIFCGTMKNIF